jgi:hypothetical protein
LGHDVYYVEKTVWADSCYDVAKVMWSDDCSYGVAFVNAILARYHLDKRWCYVDINGMYHGLDRGQILDAFRTADLFLDLGGRNGCPRQLAPSCVLIDSEPGWFT